MSPFLDAWPRIRRLSGWSLIIVCWLLIAAGLAWYALRMYPVPVKSAADFWQYGFHNWREGAVSSFGHSATIYGPWDGWFVCETSRLHGTDLFCVSEAEVEADLPGVRDGLTVNHHTYRAHWFSAGFAKWQQRSEETQTTKNLTGDIWQALLASHRAKLAESKANESDLYSYYLAREENVHDRWRRCRWYWATIAFEALFLGGMTWLVFAPVIRGGWGRWSLHLGIAPLLFMLPVYLGYATYSFTSAGPSGGVLYPHLLPWLQRGTSTELDRQIVRHLPPILEPLSSPIGSPLALTGFGMPGPLQMLSAGLGLVGLVLSVRFGPVLLRKYLEFEKAYEQRRQQKRAEPAELE